MEVENFDLEEKRDSNSMSEQCKPVNTNEITVKSSNDNAKDENCKECVGSTFSTAVDILIPAPNKDPFYWENTDYTRDYFIKNGINQNKNAGFSQSMRRYTDGTKRSCSKKLFKRVLVNGEIINREYLVYSPSQGSLFCAPCKLFGGMSQFATSGFNDWRHAGTRISEHENSASHRDFLLKFKIRESETTIDNHILSQHEQEVTYWRNVLKRVVSVVKKLASRGLAFRGDEEVFGSVKNGIFMMCLELIAEYDSFLAEHIARFGNAGKGSVSYLSPATYEEIIRLMAKSVSEKIDNEVISSKYFSVIIDSTPDMSHNDQLSVIVRYVTEDGISVERFLCFIKNAGHTGEKLSEAVLNSLESHGLKLDNCRGQSYDNAANMAGQYSGLQAKLKSRNPLIFFIPCSVHSMNLVGSRAAQCCTAAIRYFNFLQSLYNYFADSTVRWNVLETFFDSANMTLKSLSTTRWCAREDACKSLNADWKVVLFALREISESEKGKVRCAAKGLLKKLQSTETAFMTSVWGSILQQFGKVMIKLQAEDVDISSAVEMYDSLIMFLTDLQTSFSIHKILAEKKLAEIKELGLGSSSSSDEISKESRQIKRKRCFRDSSESAAETENLEKEAGSECYKNDDEIWRRMEVSYSKIIQTLQDELKKRVNVYKEYNMRFSFLSNITELEATEIYDAAEKLRAIYHSDIERSFAEECIHFKGYLLSMKKEKNDKLSCLPFLCRMLISKKIIDVYPNVYTALKIYNSTPSTNCSAERPFSTLKRIKNYLRTTQNQERLVNLGVLAIESDITVSLDFEQVINAFANAKVRKKPFY